jgi:hypothetical protein
MPVWLVKRWWAASSRPWSQVSDFTRWAGSVPVERLDGDPTDTEPSAPGADYVLQRDQRFGAEQGEHGPEAEDYRVARAVDACAPGGLLGQLAVSSEISLSSSEYRPYSTDSIWLDLRSSPDFRGLILGTGRITAASSRRAPGECVAVQATGGRVVTPQ